MPPVSDPEQPKTDSSRDFLAQHEGLNNLDSKDNQPAGDSSNPLTHSPSADSRVYKTRGDEPSTSRGEPVSSTPTSPPKSADREDLNHQEENGGDSPQPQTVHENQVGAGFTEGKPVSRLARARAKFSAIPTRWKATAGMGFLGVIVGAVFFFASFLPFELIHLKHVAIDNIGGVEGKTYTTIRGRLYSTQFFFDKNGNFSGYKAQGIRRLMFENRQTNATVQALKDNGYEINIDKGTGKILSLSKLDTNGKPIPGESYTSNSAVERAWSIRDPTALPAILKEIYPDKSDFWINRASAQLNRRWGLTRTNWLKDYAKKITGLTTLEEKELAFKSALREKLFGPGSIFGRALGSTSSQTGKACTDNTDACKASKNLTQLNSEFENFINEGATLNAKELADPSYNGLGNDLALAESFATSQAGEEAMASALGKSLLQSPLDFIKNINPAQASIYACQANSSLNKVVIGARILRSIQLMAFAMSVLNIADAVQNGKSVNTAQINALMTYLNTKDSGGHNLFAASGMQYWTDSKHGSLFSSFDRNERDQYSVGGGFTGLLGRIKQMIAPYVGGCSIITNGFVQFLGLGVGLIGAVFSDGGSLTDFGFNMGIGLLAGEAINIATQLLTPMVAGTVINGSEQGTAIGNAFVSGAETLASATGAASGMRPLTTGEAKVALADVQAQQNAQLANTGILARLFSPSQDHSLTTSAMMAFSGSSLRQVLSSPVSSLANVFHIGGIFSSQTLAADSSVSCPDTQLSSNNIATTPFCNTIMGVPDSVLNSPDYAPDKVDQEMNCIDDSGNTVAGCSPEVDSNGDPIPGSAYAAYVNQCTADTSSGNDGIDILHNDAGGEGNYTGVCTEANPNINLFNMYHLYMTAAQSENDVLTGNLAGIGDSSSSSSSSGSTTGTGSSDTCSVTKPLYGSVNAIGSEYSQAQLTKLFGDPGTATSHPVMDANLVTVDFLGNSVQVNKLVAPCLKAVAQQIQSEHINYTINAMGCYRFDSNNGTSNIGLQSYHTYGAACDINPSTNPFVESGAPTAHDMPQSYVQAFYDHGFTWGGSWHQPKDYMHFEFNGLSP